ncbi:cytochrome b561 and DOMON domain-containing protein At5g35735-like [Magnolia sinica]|uniref:cytochrome b561 and DOMON domain-containing protein At5g35735-like n=1 Tax=Magnolia sinica TaxID=86752 RepID=UPI00265A5F51|nr:cytochrome b561 and DOMON domain-containing protein At5g35735-like [Magnolia sinica]
MKFLNMPSFHVYFILIFAAASSSSLFRLSVNAHSHSTVCGDEGTSYMNDGRITQCRRLDALGAEFGWNYHNVIRNKSEKTVDVFFRAPFQSGWVAWGVNPGRRAEMVGTRALIAFKSSNGSLELLPFNITGDTKRGCRLQSSPIEVGFKVRNITNLAGYLSMFVRLDFPSTSDYNLSRLNHVWQIGEHVINQEPLMHRTTIQNFDCRETVDLTSGHSQSALHHRQHLRKVHGVLNIIGWGTILPLAIIVARYFKSFPFKSERWFRIHVPGQVMAYVIGTIGWAIGISLGNSSKNYTFTTHRILGITLFGVATLQMLAIWLRPKRNDDYRKYWHIYHHFLGYSLFSLIAVNIFQGISILSPAEKWKWAYVGILSCLGFIALVLEIITWTFFLFPKTQGIKSRNGADSK